MSNKKKDKKIEKTAIVNIHTTFNNTIVSFSDLAGKVLCWSSGGDSGLKGSRKKTAFAAQLAAKNAAIKAVSFGVEKINIVLNGRGNGRENSIRTLKTSGLNILSIKEKIKLAHNGCRMPKKRRL